MVLSYTDDFQVTWADPESVNESWILDRLHCPWPLPPLSQAILERLMTIAFGVRVVFVNGYAFCRNLSPPPSPPEIEARGAVNIWHDDFEPKVADICRRLRARDYDSMSADALSAALSDYLDEMGEAFRYTTIVVFAQLRPTAALIKFLEDELGEKGAQMAVGLLQGRQNMSTAAAVGLEELLTLAAKLPSVAEALETGRYEDLDATSEGLSFRERLAAYLDRFGWRSESWYVFHVPTWAEDETRLLDYLRGALLTPRSSAAGMRNRGSDSRQAMERADAAIPPDKRQAFRELVRASDAHVEISESRAFWQLQICGSIRQPFLALGRKLTEAGILAVPNDVFFIDFEQLGQAASMQPGPWQDMVRANKVELDRCQRLTPPSFLGEPPSLDRVPPDLRALMRHLRGYGVEASSGSNEVKGIGASGGTVRARARVIRTLEEAGRLQPGEVLITSTTSPSWTLLFSIAAAVVTDSGGLLSHTAICAREYGIPAVVGTQVASSAIPDGAVVLVDGVKGVVVVESGT